LRICLQITGLMLVGSTFMVLESLCNKYKKSIDE